MKGQRGQTAMLVDWVVVHEEALPAERREWSDSQIVVFEVLPLGVVYKATARFGRVTLEHLDRCGLSSPVTHPTLLELAAHVLTTALGGSK